MALLQNILNGAKTVGGAIGKVLNPSIPTQNGKPVNAFNGIAKIAGPLKPNPATLSVGQRATSATDGLKPPASTLPAQFKAKSTGTEAGDLSKGLISNAPIQSSTQGGTNASLTNDGSNIKAPEGMSYDGQGKLVPTTSLQSTNQNTDQTSSTQPKSQDTSYGGLIGQLANRGQSDSPEVKAARDALTKSQLEESQALNYNAHPLNGMGADYNRVMTGDANTRALYGNEQNALSSQLSSAVSTQGQQIGALNNAAGLAQPVGQFGMLTNPVNGQPLNTGVMNNALSNAYNMIKSGQTSWSDAIQSSGLSQFGVMGTNALLNILNGGQAGNSSFSPTANNAAVGQNIDFGTQQQGISQNLSYGLQQLKAIEPQALNFLSQSGINPTNIPMWNNLIDKNISDLKSPDAANTWATIKNEIQGIASQIINAKQFAGTPTTNDEMTAAQNPGQLTGQQLQNVMNNWDTLGQTTLGITQKNARNALGGSANVGTPATPGHLTPGTNPHPVNPGVPGWLNTAGNIAQAGTSIGLQILGSPGALVSWISKIL